MSYKDMYYEYQTRARSLLDKHSLEKHFKRLNVFYDGLIKTHLPNNKFASCVDIPCGYGNILYYLNSKGFKNVLGIDLDINQINLAQLLNLHATHGEAFNFLETQVIKFDLITSFDFIEHISKQEAMDFLNLCFDKLTDNGRIILRTPSADGPFASHDANNDLTHEWSMTANVLETMLRLIGFKKIVIIDEHPRPNSLIGFARWLIYLPTVNLAKFVCIALGLRPPRIWSRSMIAVAYKQ